MTTEELAVDRRLEKLLGDQDLQELIRFLDHVDHLKFAPERSNHQQEVLQEALTSWEPRVEMLRDRVGSVPGVLVEDKMWTVSVHVRLADAHVVPNVEREVESIEERTSE